MKHLHDACDITLLFSQDSSVEGTPDVAVRAPRVEGRSCWHRAWALVNKITESEASEFHNQPHLHLPEVKLRQWPSSRLIMTPNAPMRLER